MSEIVTEYPPWKEGVRQLTESEFKPGDVIPHKWLWDVLELKMPSPNMTAGAVDSLRKKFLEQFSRMRVELLQSHRIDLVSQRGEGYLWVRPGEQTGRAVEDGLDEVRKGLRRMGRRVIFVDEGSLTHEEKKER